MADTIKRTQVWKGLNRMPYIADGEMRDMKNLSSDAFPFITTRKGRKPYTFTTRIPSPAGEAYNEIERLPEASIDELGNIYLISGDYVQKDFVSGEFYYYDSTQKAWMSGIKSEKFLGVANEIIQYAGYDTLINYEYFVGEEKQLRYISYMEHSGEKVKYEGPEHTQFKYGGLYEYAVEVSKKYYTVDYNQSSSGCAKVDELPDVEDVAPGTKYWFEGKAHICEADVLCFWKNAEEKAYEIVSEVKKEAEDGIQIRFVRQISGAPAEDRLYQCKKEVSFEGKDIYYYISPAEPEGSTEIAYLPVASAENEGVTYRYVGPKVNEFAECFYEEETYVWKTVEHPEAAREITLKEYLEEYEGCGLKEIIEIEKFDGSIAVLFIDNDGKTRLFHNKDLYDVCNISGEPGKKLITVGNRLIVGESGNYLHIKEGEKTFHRVGESFSLPATGTTFSYGNGGTKHNRSYARSENGKAEIKLYSPAGKGINYSTIAEGLKTVGTGFSITIKDKTYYMKSESVDFKENYVVAGWVVADTVFEDRADILTIKATESLEDFDYDTKVRTLDITFASTDPHYYDVLAWKKRLWGYNNNVFHGTIADIFNDDGMVDWITPEELINTYTEAISQPLWQGGKITGIAALMEGLLYFKEDNITIVTGNYPAIMSSDTIPCRGLPPENRKSVAVANECVYYLSSDGVYRFAGGIPQCISRDVKIRGSEAVGTSDGNKYWLSLMEENGEYALYVYDINYKTWHKEDNTHATSFAMLGSDMYMATSEEVYNISTPQEDVDWSFELWYDEDTHRKKKYKEFIVRGNVGDCEMFIKADGGEWKLIKAAEEELRAKIPPFECEELGILIRGKGICEIKSIDRVFEVV